MSKIELDPSYDPKKIESEQLHLWDKLNCFKADPHSKKPPYCIVIPPPNVTGSLHMGHALVNTLQDVLIRYKRMQGFEALWVPGTDHAGIATQTVVEKNLIAKYGKRRNAWSRDEFLHHVWEWKKTSESRILTQLKSLGSSCDFSMLAFTMDDTRSIAVKTVFKKLFDEGLIYRGDYLVNWDPVTQTALADDEVEYEEKNGFLYHIKYPIENSSEYLVIATTRPETMLADTAIAINPTDERYSHLKNAHVIVPLAERKVPIVFDMMVEKDFGTGCVKITPAHDPNDYACSERHKLPMINLLNPDGTLNKNALEFEGLSVQQAREKVVEKLKNDGFLIKLEPHKNRVGISYRSKAVIEPYLSKQWFVKMAPFKTILRKLVDDKIVQLVPDSYRNTYDHWINNLRDWCISRQLWWGHRIPIWYHKHNKSKMLCEGPDGIPLEVQKNPHDWVQDEDVLDTWFSSALWPFSALGWPESSTYVKKFYPTSTLVTGHDILFFWVARMMAFGTHIMQEAPFKEVFLHGLIFGKSYYRQEKSGDVTYIMGDEKKAYDAGTPLPKDVKFKWEKMSKSKGNVLDPLEIMDEFGTDAVRMALVTCASQARQIDLDRRRFEEYKNFANKIWNGARFIFMNLEDVHHKQIQSYEDEYSLEDRWILTRLSQVLNTQEKALDGYFFDKAASCIYDFFWNDFCSSYLEIVKPILSGKKGTPIQRLTKQKILLVVFGKVIRALHPFTPFITEALFGHLKTLIGHLEKTKDPLLNEFIHAMQSECIAKSPYPKADFMDEKSLYEFDEIQKLLHHIREMRGELQIPPSEAILLHIEKPQDVMVNYIHIVEALTKIEHVHFTAPHASDITSTKTLHETLISVVLPKHLIQKEMERLEKDLLKTLKEIEGLESKLSVQDFLDKAPKNVIEKLQSNLEGHKIAHATLVSKLETYKKSI